MMIFAAVILCIVLACLLWARHELNKAGEGEDDDNGNC